MRSPFQNEGVRVTLCCSYPDRPPTEVTFEPGAGLGDAPEVVHPRGAELLASHEYVELPAVGQAPISLHRETVREVVVR